MSEASYLVELREAAPRAPEALRELVASSCLRRGRLEPSRRFARCSSPESGIAVAVAVGAAAISGIHGSRNSSPRGIECR